MDAESVSNGWQIALGAWSAIASAVAVYQFAVIKESKERKREFQHLLAGINSLALQKGVGWTNQLSSFDSNDLAERSQEIRVMLRARDEVGEIASLALALEGTIDTDYSAIANLQEKSIEAARRNTEFQKEVGVQQQAKAGHG